MVGLSYLVRSVAQRAATEHGGVTSFASASLTDDLCRGMCILLKRENGPARKAPCDASFVTDLIHVLTAVSPGASADQKGHVAHSLWSVTATTSDLVHPSDAVSLMDTLTLRPGVFSLPTLLEMCQTLYRVAYVRPGAPAETWRLNTAARDILLKRLVGAMFDRLPAPHEDLDGDTEAGIVEALPAGTSSRYQGTNRLRRHRETKAGEWEQDGGTAPDASPNVRMSRDEFMVMVCTVAARSHAVSGASSDGVHDGVGGERRACSPATSAHALIDDEQAAKLTGCLQNLQLIKHFPRVAASRPLEADEWSFFLSLLASPIEAWREVSSKTLLSLDTPFGSLGARFVREVGGSVVVQRVVSIARCLSVCGDVATLHAFLALLAVTTPPSAVHRSGDHTNSVVVSPVVHSMTTPQVVALLRMLFRLQSTWNTTEPAAVAARTTALPSSVRHHAEELVVVLLARLRQRAGEVPESRSAVGPAGGAGVTSSVVFGFVCSLCNIHLQRALACGGGDPVDGRLNDWISDATALAQEMLTSMEASDLEAFSVSGTDSIGHSLLTLKVFLEHLASLEEKCGFVSSFSEPLKGQVNAVRLMLLRTFTRLAATRLLDARLFLAAENFASVVLSMSEDPKAASDKDTVPSTDEARLHDAVRTFALEAVVAVLAEAFPESRVSRQQIVAEFTPFFSILTLRRALRLLADQHVPLEVITFHFTTRGVAFDLPRFFNILLARSEAARSRTAAAPAASPSALHRHSESDASQLAPQLAMVVMNALRLGALQSEASLQAVATVLRAWTADDAVVRGMHWDTRKPVLLGLHALYSSAFPHFHVSKASRVVALECLRVAARLSLSRLDPPATTTAASVIAAPALAQWDYLGHLWRFHCLAVTHPLPHRKAGKYLSIIQSYLVRSVSVQWTRTLSRGVGRTPVLESDWASLENQLTDAFRQPRVTPYSGGVANGLDGHAREDAAVVIAWNTFVTRLCRVTRRLLIDLQPLEDSARQKRQAALSESVMVICRVVAKVEPVLLPSTWNRVRRMLTIHFSVDESTRGSARKNEHFARVFDAAVRAVWRYAMQKNNTGQWAAGHTDVSASSNSRSHEEESSSPVLISRGDLVNMFASLAALSADPQLIEQIAGRLSEAMTSTVQDAANSQQPNTDIVATPTEQTRTHQGRDEVTILHTFRSMKASFF